MVYIIQKENYKTEFNFFDQSKSDFGVWWQFSTL